MNTNPGPDADSGSDTPPPPRALKAAVYIMGILLIVGFIIVFSTIIYRTVNMGNDEGAQRRPIYSGYGTIESRLPADAIIRQTELDGDRLIVRYSVGAETGIIIFDVKKGYELGRIDLRPE